MKVNAFLNVPKTITVRLVTDSASKSALKVITSIKMIRLAELSVKISHAKLVTTLQIYVSLAMKRNFFMKELV